VTAERTPIIDGHGSPDTVQIPLTQLRADRTATLGMDEDAGALVNRRVTTCAAAGTAGLITAMNVYLQAVPFAR